MDAECGQPPGQLDVLVLGVYLRGAHQASVFGEDFLLHVANLHEAQWQKLLQAARKGPIQLRHLYHKSLGL